MDHYWFETEGQTLREGKEGCEPFISVSQFCHTYSKVKQRQHFKGKLKRWRGLLFWYRPYLSFLFNPLLLIFFFYKMKIHINLKRTGVSRYIITVSFYLFSARIMKNGLAFMSQFSNCFLLSPEGGKKLIQYGLNSC